MAELKKSLSTLRLTFYGVGTIVGAGIHTVIGAAAGQAGTDLWLSFIFAAIAASVSAMSYAELSSTYPNAGAEFILYARHFQKLIFRLFSRVGRLRFIVRPPLQPCYLPFRGISIRFLICPLF